MNLGVYIQIPFCQTKCTYCNFHTGPAAKVLYAPYASAVVREIAECSSLYEAAGLPQSSRAATNTVDTVYLGGGTPSLLDPVDLERILGAVRERFAFSGMEVTLEADPETITPEKAAAWKSSGVNRVSLGAQSFNDRELRAAGRMHRREDIGRAVANLRNAAIGNTSMDLIAGLPYQTAESWEASLGELLRLRPEHVSVYLLEIDEASRLGRESLSGGSRYGAGAIPDDDTMASLYERARERLGAAGYEHYEISNWALPAFRSRHNLKYWRREPYLGFGAGAHSFDGHMRWANSHDPAVYVAAIGKGRLPMEQREEVSPSQALEEEMFLGLRQLEGIDLDRIEKQYGVQLGNRITELCTRGLLEREGSWVRLAPERIAVSNEAFVELLD